MTAFAHGVSGYSNHGCRCETCRAAWSRRMRDYRQLRKARGQCQRCPAPRARDSVFCYAHLEAATGVSRRLRLSRRERGLCMDCDQVAAPGRARCATHLQKARARKAQRQTLTG